MSFDPSGTNRRFFLKQATSCLALSVGLPWRLSSQSSESSAFKEMGGNLLDLVNTERAAYGLSKLQLDDLASRVATTHALDMADGQFVSHWGRDGTKPYHRYSFAGGSHAIQENIAAADSTWSKWNEIIQDASYLHVTMYTEKPPNDGHRRSILAFQHTDVGFGFALKERHLRVVEIFVARYAQLEPIQRKARPKDAFTLRGRLLNEKHFLQGIDVFFEPPPKPPDPAWLRGTQGSYGFPDTAETLRPKLPKNTYYADGTTGTIKLQKDGRFEAPVTLYQTTPGIYTIVLWVKRTNSEKPFPASNLCIQAE